MVTTAQLADAAATVFAAECSAKVARREAEVYAGHAGRWGSVAGLSAREALRAANWALAGARGAQADLIRRWENQ